jgi:glyoxylase-like metal-dependent hydrolase (beta-lactamase superfamily II)
MRKLLVCSLLLAIFAAASAHAQEATPGNKLPFTLKPLGHGVYAAIDDEKGDAGANAGFVVGDDGVAVIDTFEHEAAAKALLAEIRKITPLPIKFVINTHYHLDHVAGNNVFIQQGAVVLAQQNIRSWIHTENLKFFGKKITPEQKAEVEKLGAPEVTYEHGVDLYLGDRRLEVRVFPGHTGGDSVVRIADADVTFCGDLFWHKTLPNLIDATTSQWTETLKALAELSSKGTFVPGHGDVGTATDVEDFRGYLTDLRTWTSSAVSAGKTDDALTDDVMAQLSKKYGEWNFYKYFAKSNIRDMAAEIQGKKRVPQASKQ